LKRKEDEYTEIYGEIPE